MMKRTLETQTEIQGPGFDPASNGATLGPSFIPSESQVSYFSNEKHDL